MLIDAGAERDRMARNEVESRDVTKPADPKFLLSWDRRDFGPNAYFKIKRTSDAHFPNGKPDPKKPNYEARPAVWLPVTWTLHVHRASFPGLEHKEVTAEFTFARTNVFEWWTASAKLTAWWGSRGTVISTPQPPVFLPRVPRDSNARLEFKIERSDSNGLLNSLFGERIEAHVPLVLSMDLTSGGRSRPTRGPRCWAPVKPTRRAPATSFQSQIPSSAA